MLVQRVLLPATRRESWTVLGDDGPVQPIERYLGYLTDIERSPNTVKAYAHDLKDWFVFLAGQGLDWREVRLEDVAGFVAWLRRPPAMRDGAVTVLPSVEHHCGESTVNRKLSALSAFYQHAARNGVDLGELLVTWQPAGRRGTAWKPFLYHVIKGRPQARRTVALKVPRKLPRVLTVAEMQAILDACDRLRDRFLFALLYETGMRIGEALGLRHEDLAAAEREVSVVPRDNDNGARSKSREPRSIPVSAGLIRLYADYLHGEYGDLDCDYVFVNLWGQPHGHPLGYPAVYDLVRRLRRRTGTGFDPHWCRHTAATRMQGRGVASDATFRAGREHVCTGAAALPGACRGRGPGDGHAVDLGFLVPGCAGWQDVASELVALADRLMRLAHGGGGGVGARRGTLALVAADGAVPVSPGAALLEEMLAGWRCQQQARRLTARLIGERERVVRQFTAFTGCWPWQWTAAQAEAWLASGGWAHSTVRSYQGALAMFLEYVCDPRYGWVSECEQRAGAVPVQVFWERNTAAHVCEHEGRAERRPLTRGELQAFFDAADEHVEKAAGSGRKGWLAGFRDATLFKVIYGWGLRRREAAMLDVADFAPNPAAPEMGSFGVCHVRYGKAMRGSPPRRRAVATVMPWVAEALAQYLQDVRPRCGVASHPALWLTERGERISPRSIDERFAAWRAAAGLPRELSVHCLRHSYISHLIEDGADPLFVQLQAGHSWASTTATYTTVGQDARNRMLRSALARAFEGEDGR